MFTPAFLFGFPRSTVSVLMISEQPNPSYLLIDTCRPPFLCEDHTALRRKCNTQATFELTKTMRSTHRVPRTQQFPFR